MTRPTLRRAVAPLLLVLALLARTAPASAQSAAEVLNTALERYEGSTEGVRDYTVTQDVMGFTTTTRFVKQVVDGHPVFVPAEADSAAALPEGWGNPYRMVPELASRASMAGRGSVEGQETWIIEVSDLEGLELEGMTPAEVEGEFRPTAISFQVGTEDYLLRHLRMNGEVTAREGEPRPVELDARFLDYRTIEGMPHPFEIRVNVKGLAAAMPDEDMAEARRQLEELRAQMEDMPEQQREMMEQMMGPQIEQLEAMLRSGAMDVTVNVTSVEVNRAQDG